MHQPAAFAAPLPLTQFSDLAVRCAPDVAVETLASIARTESGFSPLAIYDNTTGTGAVPLSLEDAVGIASRLVTAGDSVDLGLMQINSRNLSALGLTVAAAFDPCRSIKASAGVLASGYSGGSTHAEQQAALRIAISRYNTGDAERGFSNGYVGKVEAAARLVVPALDVGLPFPPRPVAQTSLASSSSQPDHWNVWPSYPDAAPTGGTALAPTDQAPALTMADAGQGATAAVIDYAASGEK